MNLWIQFDKDEAPAPALPLPRLGRLPNTVLFFSHGPNCPACEELHARLLENLEMLRAGEAELVIVSPQPGEQPAQPGIAWLADPEGQLERRFRHLLEFDTGQQRLLFILDHLNAPYRAWLGVEPAAEDLLLELRTHLDRLQVRCPE